MQANKIDGSNPVKMQRTEKIKKEGRFYEVLHFNRKQTPSNFII